MKLVHNRDSGKGLSRPLVFRRYVERRQGVRLLLITCLLILSACQVGPPPTPTLPPNLEHTPVPTWPDPTDTATTTQTVTRAASVTATIPSKTPSPIATSTPPPTLTPIVATLTLLPTRTLSPTQSPGPVAGPPTAVDTIPQVAVIGGPPVISALPSSPGAYTPPLLSGQTNPLPIPAIVNAAHLPVVPQNTDFDGGQFEQGAQEVRVPREWVAWWRTGAVDCQIYQLLPTDGLCPALEHPGVIYKRPEFTVIASYDPQHRDPPRVYGDGWAARFFCTYGICIGGYLQRVQATPGTQYALSAMVQSWCNSETDRSHSEIQTRDDRLNCELAVGIDPTGGIDPFSPNIVWQGINAYDRFTPLATPPITAQGPVITLYLRGRSLWGFLHNDFHFDQVLFARQ